MTSPIPPKPAPRSASRSTSLTARERRKRRRARVTSVTVAAALIGALTAMMLTSRPSTGDVAGPAPAFTLTDTTGGRVSLADFRGRPVILYFSEGAGCGSCLTQMTAIERRRAAFDDAGLTVLPIVMNPREHIVADMATYQVSTPFLLDNGAVSSAYGVLGNGMHEGLPGHSFVLVDADGKLRWLGEYPSMWLEPDELLRIAEEHLA